MSEKQKHILFLPEWYRNPTDVQLAVFVEKHARAAALHHKVSLVFCGPFSESGQWEFKQHQQGNFTEYFCFYPKQHNRIKAYRAFIQAHKHCYKKLIDDSGIPDLAHLHMLFRNYVAYKKVYSKTIPAYMLTEQWSGYVAGGYQKLPWYKKRWYKKAFAGSLANTAVSLKLARAIEAIFSPAVKPVVLPNIAEASTGLPKKSDTELRILVVADLVDRVKNISGVIRAFGKAHLGRHARLTIVGDGEDRSTLEKLAKEIPLQNKTIDFKGRFENAQVLKAMQENDFLVTNSFHETFSMVTAEALLAGMPVICSRCGGPEEFVNESNGILVEVGHDEQLQAAMEKMSLSHTQYTKDDLSRPVLEKFGLEAVGQQLQKIYAGILA